MRWSYKTVHYELKKEGLLGSAFLDESEMELSFNEYGKAGWELVSILETQEGFIAVFKQPLSVVGRQATYFAEDEVDRPHVPLRAEKDDSPMTQDSSKSGKKSVREESLVVPIDEYEIIVDEEEDDDDDEEEEEVVVEKKPPTEKNDIGSIRIE